MSDPHYRETKTAARTRNAHDNQDSKEVENVTVGDMRDVGHLGGLFAIIICFHQLLLITPLIHQKAYLEFNMSFVSWPVKTTIP